MLKPTPSKPGLFSVAFKQVIALKGIAVVALASLVLSVLYLSLVTPLTAQAATNNTINFQARLEDASGAIVPDGDYNVEFKLYNVSSAGTAEWTEDYLNSASQGVHVANGYLTVNLGSITSFPSTINWDQQQWLTMNIGGTTTGSVTWDGEMNPRLQITAVPYALRASTLASSENASGYQSTLSLLQPASGVTGNEVFQVPDMGAAGTYTLMTTATGVQLQSSTPGTAQTGNFNISGTGIVNTLDATSVNINTTNSQGVLTIAGTTSDSTALGLVVNDANGNDLLQVRNDGQITLGRASGASSTIGKTNIGTNPDTGYTSLVSADKITTGPVSPTLNSISTWVGSPIDTTNNKYYLGIYTDNGGTPGTLIATSTQGTLTASSWNTLPVSASLAANTSYWLAFFTNTAQATDPYQYYDTTATVQHAYDSGVSFSGGLPSTFTSTGTSTTQHSIYASVSETGPLGTTLTVNPTNGVSILTPTSSTTAFQVQNASGTSVLSADTSNKVVSTLDLQVGTPATTNASRLFSDSFESGNLDLWSTVSGPDTIDTSNVHSGKYAAKFSPAGSGQAYIQTHINGSSTIDMRGYVYVSSQTTGSISFLTLCDSTCSSQLELYRDSATGKLAFYNSNVPSNTNGSTVMTTGAWHEVEADITINGTTGTVNVYLDGSNVISLTNQNTGSVNPTFLNAGDVGFGDTAVFSMDDIAVDSVRPGDGGNLTVGDSLHVSGTSTFGESLTIQATTDATPALTIYNSDGTPGLQIMSGGSGGDDTFIGLNAGQSNVVNTGAGTGMWNVSLGNSALHSNTSGYQNTAVGGQALQANTTGFDNAAFGLNSLQANTTGDYNAGFGWETLTSNTTGNSNSALGLAALNENTTGSDNTAVGQSALQDNQTANGNTAIGYQALLNNNSGSIGGANNTGTGQYALLDNTSGSQNTGYGWGSGAINTTGSYDTFLGYNAGNIDGDNFTTLTTLQNATALGSQAQVQASNSLVLGGAGSNQVNVGIGTTIPLNTFSVSPLDYNAGSASVGAAGTTVTGSGTLWRPSMVGEQFIFANGQTGIITAVTSYTSLTLDTSQPITAASLYRIHQIGLQVASGGTVGIGTYSPTAKLQVMGNANDSSLFQATTNSGGTVAQINANGDVNLGGNVTSGTVGKTTAGGTNAGGYANMISSQKVTTGSTGGTVSSMSTTLIGISSGSNIQFGIYADASGYPGSLIATSEVGTPVLGTNTLPISATLAPNTTYWFTYWTNGSNNNNTYDSGAPANNWYFVSPYTWPCPSSCTNGMPNTFPSSGTGLGITFNIWANYEPASAQRISGSNGSAIFQNTTDSSSAFQIQNASGTSIMSVDTSRSLVNISGNGSTSAGGPSYVNNWTSSGTNQTALSVSPGTTGDLMALVVETPNTGVTVTSITGGGVSSWNKVITNNGSGHEEIWQGTVSSTGSSTITVTFSSAPGVNVDLDATEFTAGLGAATNWSVTASGKVNNTSSSTLTYPSLTATQTDSLYWGYGRSSNSAVAGSTSGFTYVGTSSSNMVTYDTALSSGTMYSPTASNSPAGTSDGIGMIIVNSVGGGGLNDSGALTVRGNSTFNNSVVVNNGSVSAFQIQNASGSALLTADTTNMQLTTNNLNIGSPANLNAAGRIFSDGFESGNFNTWTTGAQVAGSSTVTIDTNTVHNGKYAVKFNESSSSGSSGYLQSSFTSTASSYSIRSYVNFSSLPAGNLNLFRMYSSVSGDIQAMYIDNTGKLGVTNNGSVLGTNGTALTTGAWHEVELRITLGTGSTGSISVYLDGVDQHDYTGLTTYDGTNLDNRFRLGEVVNNAGAFWADDFVIDSGTNGTGLAANANVAGSLHVSGNSSFGGAVLVQPNANTTQALLVQNSSSTAVLDVDTTNNRVGIGTATPSSILDVETNSNTVTAPQITLNQSGSGDASIALQTAAQPWYVGVSSANSGNFTISSANADKSSSTFGDTTAESNPDNSGSGYQVCSQYTPGGSGTETVSSMSVYIGSAADAAPNNLYQVAIYTDSSGPSTLVAHSASAAVTGNSWNTVTVNATITGGTPYWLCYSKNASTGSLSEITRNISGTGAYNTAGTATFGTWNTTFPAHSSDFDGYAIFANYSQSGTYNTFGSSLMSLSTIGQATFENSTNSTSAFQVQNALGVNLLGVNTSGSTVNIGAVGSTVLSSVVNIASTTGAAQTVTIGSTNGASSTTIQGGSGGIVIGSSTTANAVTTQAQGITNTLTGSATAPSDVIKTTTNSTNAFQVQNSNTQSLFTVDTANNALVLGNDITPIALTLRGGTATGNNVGGSNITFQASNGTGAGGSGSFIFQTGKPSGNAVGVDNTGEVLITTGTSLTMSYTTGSQSSRLMVVQLVTLAGRSFTAVTYNGVALTKLTTKTSGSVYEEVWYLVNPASGTNSLVATENTSGEASMEAATFYNVDQTTPLGTSATASGATSGTQPTSLNVSTSTSAQLVIDDIAIDTSTAGSLTNGTGQTQLWDYVAGSGAYISGSAYKSGSGGTVNMSWNVNSADWADIGVPINPTSNSTTDTLSSSLVINNAGNVGVDNSNPQYSLDVAGTERIQTTTNSTSAFVVQNSGGTNLLTVDSSDNIVQIGSATSDSTAVLLQLDRYTQVTDPPGTNGAMYYNTTLGRFRCYQDDWYDCIGISADYQRQHPFFSTDFMGASTPYQNAPWTGSNQSAGGNASVFTNAITANHPGVVGLYSGAVANGGYRYLTSTGNTTFIFGGGESYEAVFNPNYLTTSSIRMGFWDGSDATSTVANGAYVDINSSGVLTGKTASGSAGASTGSTYTVSTSSWYHLKIVVNGNATQIDYYLYNDNGTQLWHDSLTTDIPTASVGNGVSASCTDTSNHNIVNMDYMSIWEANQLNR